MRKVYNILRHRSDPYSDTVSPTPPFAASSRRSSPFFWYLRYENAVTHNPVTGVARPADTRDTAGHADVSTTRFYDRHQLAGKIDPEIVLYATPIRYNPLIESAQSGRRFSLMTLYVTRQPP